MTQKLPSPDDLDCDVYEAGDDIVTVDTTSTKNSLPKKAPGSKDTLKRPDLLNMSVSEVSEYVLSTFKRNRKSLSPVELQDLRIPSYACSIIKAGDSEDLAKEIKQLLPDHNNLLSKTSNRLSVLVISSSAIRATEIIRFFGGLRQQCGIGKCFAKHFKIEEQLSFFNNKRPAIAVGTPNRLIKLFASGHEYFNFDDVKLVMIDTYRDQKQRNIFEIPETCVDLLDFYSNTIRPSLEADNCKLVFF